jgi:2,4-dienoyl-CoA reductase-like NADH-dependent reductase (Old Yellow Enzyme family)
MSGFDSVLFRPLKMGSVEIPNRFVRSATHEFMAEDDGTPTDRQAEVYRQLAEGEVGLIVTGHAFVNPAGKASPRQTGIHDDRLLGPLSRLAASVRGTPAKIFVQIAHAGRQTKPKLCGSTPVAPSAVFDPSSNVQPREMSAADIRETVDDFVRAAVRGQKAGFDGVQLHAAHGYLLSTFISPHTNRRTDEWGGSVRNRSRILVDIIRGVRAECGREFPLFIKLNSTDFLPTGLRLEEAVEVARILEAEGLDAVEVSGGMAESGRGSVWTGLRAEDEEGYFVENAAAFKAALRIPVSGLGGNRTLARMAQFVREGRADFISLSRPLIRDPFLVRKFRLGETPKSECVSCNKCFNPRGISCGDLKRRP